MLKMAMVAMIYAFLSGLKYVDTTYAAAFVGSGEDMMRVVGVA